MQAKNSPIDGDEADIAVADSTLQDGRQSDAALAIQRGVTRHLMQQNIACLPELVLPNHRRADLMAINAKGELAIIEIKSGLADFLADKKWPDYLPYCDQFYFAVAPDFPVERLPSETGLIFADAYGAEIMREAPFDKLAAARRLALMRRIARIGAFRWAKLSI